jgi:DNA-directed RNA polymerase I subunit RPA2
MVKSSVQLCETAVWFQLWFGCVRSSDRLTWYLTYLQSVRCNLRSMSSAELVAHHEEPEEFGGYFIINGNERLIRYLILPRRNQVIALSRPSFTNRGPSYTPSAVQIRCVRPDQTSVTNTLHYLSNGSAMFRFSWRKQEYVIPIMLILKALTGASDKEIFEGIMMQDYDNTFLTDRVELLLRSYKVYNLYTGDQCLEYLGDKFRVVLGLPEDWDNRAVGIWLIQKLVLIHIESAREKFKMLLCVPFSSANILSNQLLPVSCFANCTHWFLKNAALIIRTLPRIKRSCFLVHSTG